MTDNEHDCSCVAHGNVDGTIASEDLLAVPRENVAVTEAVNGSSSPRVGPDSWLVEQQARAFDDAFRRLQEADRSHPGNEEEESLDWSELPLEDDLVDLLAEDTSAWHSDVSQ